MIKFQDSGTLAAARAHVSSLRWRMAVGALFALGASFVLNSFAAGFGWFLAVMLSTGFDAMLGHSYLDVRGTRERRTSGVLFVWGCAFSVMITAGMTLYLAAAGGGPGRVLGALMAASAFVSAMLFLFRSPAFMMISAAPAAVCLLVMPFLPFLPGPADALMGALGAGCGVAGFFAYVLRAAYYNTNMVNGLRAANAEAKGRQVEAEAKRAEAEAANRAKSEFLAVMTHELRTPLNAVIGYAEIIEEDMNAEGRAELAGDAVRITSSARHLLKLIDQILSMASIDAGQTEFSLREIDVRKLVDDAVSTVQGDAKAGGNRISVRVAPDAERAFSDPDKLAICITALLSNAVKFTSNGLIAVTVERVQHGDRVWLSLAVSDTGIGIAAEDIARVFAPFTQIDGSATRLKGGMGLGLSIVQRMARALGGELSVTSEVAVGSTFTLLTPQLLAPAELAGRAARVAA